MPPKKQQAARRAAPAPKKAKKTLTFADAAADEANKAVHTTRHVKFAEGKGTGTAAAAVKQQPATKVAAAAAGHVKQQQQQRGGIVTAASVRKGKGGKGTKRPREEDEAEDAENEDSDDGFDESGEVASLVDDDNDDADDRSASEASSEAGEAGGDDEDEDDLSALADKEESDKEEGGDSADDEDNPFVKAKRTGGKLAYKVLRLRFLPPAFQEPQLFKFLGQFGAEVLNCFCVRSRRTHQSKGIAYVQFDRDEVLPLVLEECNGMALGGRAVRARVVTLRRAMPSKEKVAKRRRLAYAYSTKGAPLKHHNVLRKNPVALLIKAARTETSNNAYLKSLGIDFQTDFFTEQLKHVPANLITKNTKVLVDAGNGKGSGGAASASPAPLSPAASQSVKKSPVKAVTASAAKSAATPPPRLVGKKSPGGKKKGGRASV